MTDTTFVSRRERRRQAKPSLARAVVNNTGPMGRGAAVAVAASGLVLTGNAAANAYGPGGPDEGRDYSTVQVPTSGQSAEQAVSAAPEGDVNYDRPVFGSTAAPEPEPAPEPAPAPEQTETYEASAAEQALETEQTAETEPVAETEPAAESSDSIVPASTPGGNDSGGDGSIVGAAHDGLGTPYAWGGKGPGGWDCSGFASWAYAQAGKNIPSNTYAMMDSMEQVSEPSPGDLVIQNGGSHVAIYVGNGQLIGANNPSQGTTMYSLDSPYWQTDMFLTA